MTQRFELSLIVHSAGREGLPLLRGKAEASAAGRAAVTGGGIPVLGRSLHLPLRGYGLADASAHSQTHWPARLQRLPSMTSDRFFRVPTAAAQVAAHAGRRLGRVGNGRVVRVQPGAPSGYWPGCQGTTFAVAFH
eukprot:scaffold7513_cov296-Pinguiococcus_pyrenoidosus.AAC.5